ncbi:MAG: dipeptidase [Rhizobiaceae bacterium]
MSVVPVFDGHNDVLMKLTRQSQGTAGLRRFLDGHPEWHIDLPKAREGGFAGGLFALFAPLDPAAISGDVDAHAARSDLDREIAALFRLERISDGAIKVCRTHAELRSAIAAGQLAVVIHIEGIEAIDVDLDALELFYAAGLRSLGPVWARPNAFAHGVPPRMNATPDIGPGLTAAGKELVRACNALGVMIDLSHLNEQGFWDVARISVKPLVATHSNAHALCPHSRNLTDRQLDAIRDSCGLVGVNYATGMLREDGLRTADTSIDVVIRHVDYLLERLGVAGVALGSDFDGTIVPAELGNVAGQQKIVQALRSFGYDEALVRRICHGNWLEMLEKTWG